MVWTLSTPQENGRSGMFLVRGKGIGQCALTRPSTLAPAPIRAILDEETQYPGYKTIMELFNSQWQRVL